MSRQLNGFVAGAGGLVVGLLLSAAASADWPQWRGPQRDGIAHDESVRTDWDANPPKLLWHTTGFGGGY
ncbi:MAG: hypothetical protein R3B90_15130 [Planctomycetaceae bacterium]